MSETNQPMTYEEMAMEEAKGLRPEGSVVEQKGQFTRDQVLSENAKMKAEEILKEADQAKAEGDAQKIEALEQQALQDPELGGIIQEKQAKQKEEGLDLSKVRQAGQELQDKFSRIVHLSLDAAGRGAITHSLFNNDEERERVINRVKKLADTLQDTSPENIQIGIEEFTRWYRDALPVIRQRTQHKLGYFGGYLPDELVAQARLFDQMEADVGNLNHYLRLATQPT